MLLEMESTIHFIDSGTMQIILAHCYENNIPFMFTPILQSAVDFFSSYRVIFDRSGRKFLSRMENFTFFWKPKINV